MKRKSSEKKGNERQAEREALIAFHLLAEATVGLHHRLQEVAERVHGDAELSDPKRAVLMTVHRKGRQTVPQITRTSRFSRQHILNVVNALGVEGYVELVENPDHKRSHHVCLTSAGEELVDRMNRRETEILRSLSLDISEGDMRKAAATLCAVRGLFEGKRWAEVARKHNL